MSKMWRGPSDSLKAAYSDPLATAMTRRCGRLGIFFNIQHDGRKAEVFTLRGDYKVPAGEMQGGDPLNVILNVALQHTPFDADLRSQAEALLARRTDEVIDAISDLNRRLPVALEDIAIAHASLASYVRA